MSVHTRAGSPLPWLGGLLAVYLLAPIVAFVVRLGGGASTAPGLFSALATSLLTATISAAVVTVLGTPLAYLLARSQGVGSRVVVSLIALPLALPPLMSGILLLYVFGPLTFIGGLFGGKLTDTRAGIVLAQTFVAAPFLIIAARAAFASVDPALEDVAASLGHGRLARFTRVAIPSALPGIGAGIMLTWLRAFGEFGATVILAYHPFSLPVFTFVQFDETGLPATMAPIAAALAAALIVLICVQLPWRRRRRSQAFPSPAPASPQPPAPLCFSLAKRLGGFSLDVSHQAQSPRLALLGPSGAGKTLTLRLLAGLATPSHGATVRAGERALDRLPAQRRGIGYVPQQAALMPRRTVWRQVTFGVGAQAGLAAWWIEQLGLAGLEDRYPHELSGGQQRRVALARALAVQPRLLLLDEPFAGLDAPVRDRLRRELRRLQRETGLSSVLVTHDPDDAAMLAEEIVVLGDGHMLQAGTCASVFNTPSSPEVAALLGVANTHRGVVHAGGRILTGGVEIHSDTGTLPEGQEVVWSIRPERIAIRKEPTGVCEEPAGTRRESGVVRPAPDILHHVAHQADGGSRQTDGGYEATVLDCVDLGSLRELTVAISGGDLELTIRTTDPHELGVEQLHLDLPPSEIAVWPAAGNG